MRFLTLSVIYYVLIAIVVCGIGGYASYNLIKSEIDQETDYYLDQTLENIEDRIRNEDLAQINSNQIFINEIPPTQEFEDPVFSDTIAMHPHLDRMETLRKLYTRKKIANKYYEITIVDVIWERSDIYESVVKIIFQLFGMLAVAMVLASFFLSQRLFRPLTKTIQKIKDFEIDDNQPLLLPDNGVKEFSNLNHFINDMTRKARIEYQNLKKFSENASHEIQTPLAIVQGKLELLANSESLNPDQYKLISSAQSAMGRLSKISKSLTLLTKIGNQEFVPDQINFSALIEESLENFSELFDMKELNVRIEIQPNINVKLNRHLGIILINNLLQNAIKHNIKGGFIEIHLGANLLSIRNSGGPEIKDPGSIFKRFGKKDSNSDSAGLGLAIVKEICELHNMKIGYEYDGGHQFNIVFNKV